MTHEDTALIVPRDDHHAMAASAIRLLDDNALAVRLGENGRVSCRRFTWPAVRDEWMAAYAELTRGSRDRVQQNSGGLRQASEGAQ